MNFELMTFDLVGVAHKKCDILLVLLTNKFQPGMDPLSTMIAQALKLGDLSSKVLWTPAPQVQSGAAWENMDEFIRAELENFLWGYRRNLMQGQQRYVEVWTEQSELTVFFSSITLDY